MAAAGPGSSHPPSSSNAVILPLIWMIPFLSQGSIWLIILVTPWTATGDPASPWPDPHSSPYLLALAFTWPVPLLIMLGTGQKHSHLQWIPAHSYFLSNRTAHLEGSTETCNERLWLSGIGCWDPEEVHWGHRNVGMVEGSGGIAVTASALARAGPAKEEAKERGS